ncbi:Chitinase 4 [Didymella glomerata]|uniref:chitinase n=1 Tax=Didymella glomerata TaxID=749621 RepID=A0A9W9BVR6_9PLEO|nr:Chitinase 4 [Didymella glomerata]
MLLPLALTIVTAATVATAAAPSELSTTARAAAGYRSVAYFPNWAIYARNFRPQDVNATALTHLNYAFANVRPETGEVYLSDPSSDTGNAVDDVHGCVEQLFLQKKRHRGLKTLLSIGGITYSAHFPQPASTAAGRSRFASSAVQLLADLGFDALGLDVDWEYPEDEAQASDLVALLAETRKQLDEYARQHVDGGRLLLTVASPAGRTAYDYVGSWSPLAGHSAAWNTSSSSPDSTPASTQQAVADYIRAGVPADKIVVGMPLYGRSFANTDGPGTAYSGTGPGGWEPGLYDYKNVSQLGGVTRQDDTAIAAWSYDGTQRLMISYDTPDVVSRKAREIHSQKLGGAMWWEVSGDAPGNKSLVSTFAETIAAAGGALEQSENLLSYPASKYQNLRAGMPSV